MRHFYKSHGKHCYLRSFQTKCRKCGADVLYWECRHGSKIFFDYPPYGKLIKHICRQPTTNLQRKKSFPVSVKTPKGLLEKESPSCPMCGKLFKTLESLNDHLNNLKNQDSLHESFNKNNLDIDFGHQRKNRKNFDKYNVYYGSKFGKINVKKKK